LLDWRSGGIKQRILYRLLLDRRENPLLYAEANYEPLYARGELKNHVLAFRRNLRDEILVIILPRFTFGTSTAGNLPLGMDFWGHTEISIGGRRWFDVVSLEERELPDNVKMSDLFSSVPFAVLRTSL
jgi:(1->4)-alpha-D-glucan 1-alpha-D-glucosylmutase